MNIENFVNRHNVEIKCPECGQGAITPIGQLQTGSEIHCQHCGHDFSVNVDRQGLDNANREAQEVMNDFLKTLRDFGQ